MYAPAIDELVIHRTDPVTEAGGETDLELEILEFDFWDLSRKLWTASGQCYACPGSLSDDEESGETEPTEQDTAGQ